MKANKMQKINIEKKDLETFVGSLREFAIEQGYLKGMIDEIREWNYLVDKHEEVIDIDTLNDFLNLRLDVWEARMKMASKELQDAVREQGNERNKK